MVETASDPRSLLAQTPGTSNSGPNNARRGCSRPVEKIELKCVASIEAVSLLDYRLEATSGSCNVMCSLQSSKAHRQSRAKEREEVRDRRRDRVAIQCCHKEIDRFGGWSSSSVCGVAA